MADASHDPIHEFLFKEYASAAAAIDACRIDRAWGHLERAHIASQSRSWAHCRSHLRMLAFAIQLRDGREVMGQILRLVLAPLGNLTGRLPIGNTGRSNISAFAPMAMPTDIEAILDAAST